MLCYVTYIPPFKNLVRITIAKSVELHAPNPGKNSFKPEALISYANLSQDSFNPSPNVT